MGSWSFVLRSPWRILGMCILLAGLPVMLPASPVMAAGGPSIICVTTAATTLTASVANACNEIVHDANSALTGAALNVFNSTNGVDVYFFADAGATAASPTTFNCNVTIFKGGNVPSFVNVYANGPVELLGTSASQPVLEVDAGLNIQFTGFTIAGGQASFGAGGLNIIGNATVTLVGDTFFNNTATMDFGKGGTLYNGGGTLTGVNVTVSNNSAGKGLANALFNDTGGTATFTSSTFAFNTGVSGSFDIYNKGTMALTNSLIQGTVGGPNAPTTTGSTITPTIPGLSSLADNGGQVETDAFNSAAADCALSWGNGTKGPDGQPFTGQTDARPAPRPQTGNACSPGAYQAFATSYTTPISSIAPANLTLSVGMFKGTTVLFGGAPLYDFKNVNGLPPGMHLGGDSLLGTPTTPGSYLLTFQAVDKAGQSVSVKIDITVNSTPLKVTPDALPLGMLGVAYNTGVVAQGGQGPYTFNYSGDLPPGIRLDPDQAGTSLSVHGTPTTPGTYNFTIFVTDGANTTVSHDYTITVYRNFGTYCDNRIRPNASVGQTLQCYAAVKGEGATDPQIDVTSKTIWSSSDPAVATVDAQGKVTAIAPGATTITGFISGGGGVIGQNTVTVLAPLPPGVSPASAPQNRSTGSTNPSGGAQPSIPTGR